MGTIPGSGGTAPISEPETATLRDWLLALRDQPHKGLIRVIFYHSAVPPNGMVQPGYSQVGQPDPAAEALARSYSNATGYPYSSVWVGVYEITGEAIHWASLNGLAAIDVELPDRGAADPHLETNLRGLLAVMAPAIVPTPID